MGKLWCMTMSDPKPVIQAMSSEDGCFKYLRLKHIKGKKYSGCISLKLNVCPKAMINPE